MWNPHLRRTPGSVIFSERLIFQSCNQKLGSLRIEESRLGGVTAPQGNSISLRMDTCRAGQNENGMRFRNSLRN